MVGEEKQTSEAAPESLLSGNQRNKIKHASHPFGNYFNYYFHRTAAVPDARLALLPTNLFKGAKVLDLGCNAGKLTIEVVTHLEAVKSLGVDLDPVLIEKANEAVRLAGEDAESRCKFIERDFMGDPDAFFSTLDSLSESSTSDKRFNTILLLSVTKWLHLHHGDSGLQALFRALHSYLEPVNGVLVIEPQEWENYIKATNKNKSLKPMFKQIKMRPPFTDDVNSAGFRLEDAIEREEGGFSRPLMIWRAGENLKH
ncbi:Bin3-domain-containing protein [Meredithblackwellia eburnea MCA 4105]